MISLPFEKNFLIEEEVKRNVTAVADFVEKVKEEQEEEQDQEEQLKKPSLSLKVKDSLMMEEKLIEDHLQVISKIATIVVVVVK